MQEEYQFGGLEFVSGETIDGLVKRAVRMEREECAKLIERLGYSHSAGLNQFVANEFLRAANMIRQRG